ncbi:hypothetical protein [Gloeobacter morelensis]|uniref:hypothetical protein n=1 Tax=Gloeobacter morelensis TaxID=2907343 RepID=UPI001E2D1025|nr:hypothetical protein [Gloeobacter morelensis]UFP97144.1 hypothetical protein ISF26_23775 [Gloeobacter morelensis MG652769]
MEEKKLMTFPNGLEELLEGANPGESIAKMLESVNPESTALAIVFVRAMLESGHWPTESLGYHLVRPKRRVRMLTRKQGDRNYISFGELCYDYGISPSTGYQRADYADPNKFPRFEAIRKTECTMTLLEVLSRSDIDDELFDVLASLLELNCPERLISEVLSRPEPLEEAWKLAHKIRISRLSALENLERKRAERVNSKAT